MQKRFFLIKLLTLFPLIALLSNCDSNESSTEESSLIGWYYNNYTIDDTTHKGMYQYALEISEGNLLRVFHGLSSTSWSEKGHECIKPVECSLGTWYTQWNQPYCSYTVVDNKLYAPTCEYYTIWTITKDGLIPDGLAWYDGASPLFVKK